MANKEEDRSSIIHYAEREDKMCIHLRSRQQERRVPIGRFAFNTEGKYTKHQLPRKDYNDVGFRQRLG